VNRSRLQIAKPDIVAFFESGPKVLRERQLSAALSQGRSGWRLAQRTTVEDFVTFLVKSAKLRKHRFDFPNRPETLYVWGDVPLMDMLLELKPHSYYSHYTAMRLHGLTEQVPKVIYISHERAIQTQSTSPLTQDAIDAAFQRPPRISNNAVQFGGHRVILINSAFTAELGVVDNAAEQGSGASSPVRVTGVERTLIDAAVRPAYCGGVFEVAKAFELAKEAVSVNAMGAMLHKLRYAYPYHQVIGYYLERAGYRDSVVDLMRQEMHFDFYLAHDMGPTRYEPAWRLHVPKGF
jgi:AbiEi antitoxin C-terminal domain